jgi:hypothetical protein
MGVSIPPTWADRDLIPISDIEQEALNLGYNVNYSKLQRAASTGAIAAKRPGRGWGGVWMFEPSEAVYFLQCIAVAAIVGASVATIVKTLRTPEAIRVVTGVCA